jgi:hypothetical protein
MVQDLMEEEKEEEEEEDNDDDDDNLKFVVSRPRGIY